MHSLTAAFLLSVTPLASAAQRGLAYNDPNLANYFSTFGTISWGYDWGYSGSGLFTEYVPMLHDVGASQDVIDGWNAAVSAAAGNGVTSLLAFNEPDLAGVLPADAATAYMNYMQPYAGQFKLGAPAVTNGGAPLGLTWLDEFLGNCSACTIDFVPFHWYDSWDNVAYFSNYVPQAYAAGGNRPLWLTEFQGLNGASDQQQIEFIETVVPWLDSLDYMERYSYFGVFENILINGDGSGVSDIGQEYGSSTAINSTPPTTVD